MTEPRITLTPLGDNQWARETVTVDDGTRHVVREQWTGHPDSPAGVLIGSTETCHFEEMS